MAPKRDPEQQWRALVKEADEDERAFRKAASASVAEAERSLAEAGVDVKAERGRGTVLRREIEARVAARKARAATEAAPVEAAPVEAAPVKARDPQPARPLRPPRHRRQVPAVLVWLGVTVGAAAGGAGVYVSTHPVGPLAGGGPTAPSHRVNIAPPPSPPELASAADHRRLAFAACDESSWDACLAELEVARSLDPDGDDAPEVQAARRRALTGMLGPKPGQKK